MFPTARSDRRRRRERARPARSRVELCESRLLLAATVVADLNPTPAGSDPGWITALNGTALFAASTGGTGRELWRSDGTPGGTALVKDARPGPAGIDPDSLVNLNGTVLFIGTGAPGTKQLWRSDGTAAGTAPVTDRVNLYETGYFGEQRLVVYHGAVYFRGQGADGSGVELWRSDGTDAGTFRLKDINPAGDSRPAGFTEVSGKLYFVADDGTHGGELWATDGTEAGTVMVEDIRPGPLSSYPSALTRAGGLLFFTARSADNPPTGASSLWRSDGTAQGTFKLLDPDASGFSELQGAGDTLYFISGSSSGSALWKSDGTVAGTRRLADYRASDLSYGYVSNLTDVNGTLYYRVLRAIGPAELWKVSPGSDDPVQLETFGRAPDSIGLDRLTNVGGRLFFDAFTADAGMELWTTDGAPGGARRAKDIAPGPESSHPLNLADIGGVAFFNADRPDTGRELWRSDGTDAGTVMVKEIEPATQSSAPFELEDVDGTLFFATGSLYKVNPAQDGVELVFPGYGLGNLPTDLTASGDSLYFGAYQIGPIGGPWLMKSDGTREGTVEVTNKAWVQWVTDLDHHGSVLFASTFRDGELWRSDGTDAGTVLLKDIRPGADASNPSQLVNLNGTVFFSADDGAGGRELWKSDGTEAGTVRVKDIVPGAAGSNPQGLVPVGNQVFFRVTLPGGGTELWKSDGTDAGTVRVAAVGPFPGAVGTDLFVPGDWQRGAALGDVLVFAATDSSGGVELWRSDGTEAGTFRLKDIEPGPASSDPAWFATFDGEVYFGAYDSAGGRELWSTDGTPGGTARAADLHPGIPSSDPAWLTTSGGALWFSAFSPLYGRELWKFTPDAPAPAAVVGRHVFYNNSAFDGVVAPANPIDDDGAADDAAIAPDKAALLPGGRAGFENVTSYSRGINGVMIDVQRLPPGAGPRLEDFTVRAFDGNGGLWRAGPPARVTLRRGAGVNGSDRVTLTWFDYNPASASAVAQAVVNGWLEVTMRSTAATGLAAPDVFYFGNLVGDTGGVRPAAFSVDGVDLSRTRRALFSTAPIDSRVDFNRDGYVSAADFSLCRANLSRRLPRIAPPARPRIQAADAAPPPSAVPARPIAYVPRRRASLLLDERV
jgi:ELWxxDGT repeat protein